MIRGFLARAFFFQRIQGLHGDTPGKIVAVHAAVHIQFCPELIAKYIGIGLPGKCGCNQGDGFAGSDSQIIK